MKSKDKTIVIEINTTNGKSSTHTISLEEFEVIKSIFKYGHYTVYSETSWVDVPQKCIEFENILINRKQIVTIKRKKYENNS